MGSVSPLLLLLGVVLFRLVSANKVATELITPDFAASYFLFIDTFGVFLNSRNGSFQAVVYNPAGNQDRFYLAVVHAPSKTCVWVANRAAPITDRAAPLRLTAKGIHVEDPTGATVWSTPAFGVPVAALRLHDSGNLALLDARNATLWQSFDVPTDTVVSSQRVPLGVSLASAASDSDFSVGAYRLEVTPSDAVLTWTGSTYWRLSGDGKSIKDRDGAVAEMLVNGTGVYLLGEDGGVVIQVTLLPYAALRIVKLGSDGKLRVSSFASANASSSPTVSGAFEAPSGGCDLPLSCGALGLCTPRGCTCPPLFAASQDGGCAPSDGSTALSVAASAGGDGGGGRVGYASLGKGVAYYANKFAAPDLAGQNISSCQALCSGNCSCLGYFYVDSSLSCYLVQHQLGSFISANLWTGGSDKLGYIKVQRSSESSKGSSSSSKSSNSSTLVAILLPTVVAFVLIVVVTAVVINSWRKEKQKRRRRSNDRDMQLRRHRSPSDSTRLVHEIHDEGGDDDIVIPGLPTRFTHEEIEDMTNSFRIKIGAGGFGAVYKGQLPDGSLVAVKKIEGVGTQGKREFCTEIAVIGNIHHVNLVRLRGFCAEGQRRLLVYEYMNRGSLDRSLFLRPTGGGPPPPPLLEWKERVDVAVGAARGLAYLHFGCDHRIIHCDVKPENILLADGRLVKIADFGLAKLLTPEQSGLFTTMRGTRGYLAPEWLSNAPITDRTDVYSFGMVLLELVRGRKNRSERVSEGTGGEISGSSSSGTTGSGVVQERLLPAGRVGRVRGGAVRGAGGPEAGRKGGGEGGGEVGESGAVLPARGPAPAPEHGGRGRHARGNHGPVGAPRGVAWVPPPLRTGVRRREAAAATSTSTTTIWDQEEPARG
ncbi:hypothetical protein PR202_gb09954 [Eleusine coracana subsp. coracana]|uniref:Receptor-like serine/threonine-protein kinase n=1 Tax=Eleusine coracana subsp. coracana TaxID=191504 RepID=A0AAV5EI25_ELECO|nr:hypothetical protein PR202_gb09954 [Eleusine coracana subsp. coracana]